MTIRKVFVTKLLNVMIWFKCILDKLNLFSGSDMLTTLCHRHLFIENNIRYGLENHEFILYYQPEISSAENQLTGFEALIRWNSKKLGMIYPGDFIPIAEDNGSIIELGKWVFKTACIQAKKWEPLNNKLKVSINISAKQFGENQFYQFICETIKDTKVNPCMIEIEITETTLMDNVDKSVNLINKIKSLGISVAVDDFGTGYSSLMFLKAFPLDTLKIDKIFITDICENTKDASIVKIIISLGHLLNMNVIAEGVETSVQAQLLKKYDCDTFQGYLFGKPMPTSKATDLLTTGS